MSIKELRTPRRPCDPAVAGSSLIELLSDPQSVIVVGASAEVGSYSHRALSFLLERGFRGRLYAVNPKYNSVQGVDCYPRIADVPEDTIDVGLVAVAAAHVVAACTELAEIGAAVAVVFATGLTSADRLALHKLAKDNAMRIIGPDCIGTVAIESGAYLTFSSVAARAASKPGPIGLVTQSGAMGNSILLSLFTRGLNISHWVSSGGELDVGALEVTTGLLSRPEINVVALYLEGVTDPEWVVPLSRAIRETGKLVVAVRSAVSAAGKAAAAGHTGRVVGVAAVSRAVLQAAGVVLVPSIPSLVDAIVARSRMTSLAGPRVAVVSVSGGAGVLTADAVCATDNLVMADLSGDAELSARRSGRVTEIANPLDVPIRDESQFCAWVGAVAASPSVDVTIAIQAGLMHDEQLFVDALLSHADVGQIVVTSFNEDQPLSELSIIRLGQRGVPYFPTPERAIYAISAITTASSTPPGTQTSAANRVDHANPDSAVGGLERAEETLGSAVPWSEYAVVETLADAEAVAQKFGYPVVVKAAGRTLQHRTESGAVAVNVDEAGFAETYRRIRAVADGEGDAVIVQRQAAKGLELLMSLIVDPEVGPAVIVRPGGTLVEIGVDESTVVWGGWDEIERADALRRGVVGRLLAGYRGQPGYDSDAVLRLATMLLAAAAAGSVTFVELNPVIVGATGLAVVDALVR